ncbi:MAG: phosphonate ABC transporter substrate-binding protein [Burkholderiales bacterium]|nr:phosphonate ABC transporter substrate-binding protein [Burkholderiales bacterium]
MFGKYFLSCALGLGLAWTINHSQAAEMKEINFGIISTEASANLKQDWQPLLEAMSKKLGMKVNAFFAPDYAGVIEGMRFNKVQLAWYGNKSGMEAVDRSSGEVFAKTVFADGSMGYHSILAVPADSPYKTLEDVLKNSKNVNFGIGDPNSTSGFLVPSYYIFAQHNVDPKTAFKTIRGSNHESNIMAVANKQADASVFASETLDRVVARQPEIAKKIREVWRSPLIPSDPIVWRKDLPQEVKVKIKDFLLAYGKSGSEAEQEKAVLKKLNLRGFLDSNDAQLKPIRQLELFKQKTKLEADAGMNADEKKAKIADIDRKLSDLAKG